MAGLYVTFLDKSYDIGIGYLNLDSKFIQSYNAAIEIESISLHCCQLRTDTGGGMITMLCTYSGMAMVSSHHVVTNLADPEMVGFTSGKFCH